MFRAISGGYELKLFADARMSDTLPLAVNGRMRKFSMT